MKKNLVQAIVKKAGVNEAGLRVTLSKIKKRHDLKSIEQAACYYIKKQKLDINVSSTIDPETRQLVQELKGSPPHSVPVKISEIRARKPRLPKIKWMSIRYYTLAARLNGFYGYLFLFENALREKIDIVMRAIDAHWWESKIKLELPDVYKYAEDEKARQAKLPMIGQAGVLKPYDYLTLGHLESIIVKYQKAFVPSVFPNIQFFTGHMMIVKRVRNAIAHMAPSTTLTDVRNAKNEIDILLQHFATL